MGEWSDSTDSAKGYTDISVGETPPGLDIYAEHRRQFRGLVTN